MCGRYYFDIDEKELKEIVEEIQRNIDGNFKTGEIYPTNIAPIITNHGATLAKWGFPKWDNKDVVINARVEGLADKIMFKNLTSTNRCIIPASGFFEWKRNPSEVKQKDKYYFKRPGSPLYIAGLFNTFHDKAEQLSIFGTDKEQPSYVIITKDANEYMSDIHDRMPLIFTREEMHFWLQGRDLQELLHGNNTILKYAIS